MNFKKGDYVYYFDGIDTFSVKILAIKKRAKINIGLSCENIKDIWVSTNSLTLQSDTE